MNLAAGFGRHSRGSESTGGDHHKLKVQVVMTKLEAKLKLNG
jgi:hypothetical protein